MKRVFTICTIVLTSVVAYAANDDFEAASRRVAEATQSQQFKEAQNAAKQMLSLAQNSQEKSRALLNLGIIAKKENRVSEARQFWTQVLQLKGVADKYKANAYFLIGGSFLDENNPSAARESLQKFLQVNGVAPEERAIARVAIAASYRNQKMWPETVNTLEQVVSDESVSPVYKAMAQQLLGEAYFDQEKWPEAIAAFHAIAEIKDVSPTLIATGQSRANDAYVQWGHTERIAPETTPLQEGFLKKADEIAQSNNRDVLLIRENLAAALILTNPDSVLALWTREKIAETYLVFKDYAKAREELEKLAVYPTPADATDSKRKSLDILRQKAQENLAASYRLEGQTARARQEYQKVLQMPNLDPNIQRLVQKQLDELK